MADKKKPIRDDAEKHPARGSDDKPPEDADPRAAEVVDRWSQANGSISQELSEYWLNYFFVAGFQWLWVNQTNQRVEELARKDEDAVRLTFNRMRSGSRTIIGKLTQRDLTFEVPPTDADDAHLRGARIGESLLENIRIGHCWEQKREIAAWAAWKAGTAAICVEWDAQAGDVAAAPEDTGGQVTHEGDTLETVLNLSEFVVEPGTRDAETATWWIRALLLPPAEVRSKYSLPYTPAADGNIVMSPFQIKALEKDRTIDTPLTRVLTMYERPNQACPEGRVMVVVGHQVVWEGKWPFPWKSHLNIAVIKETPVETRWTGDTVLTDARGVQVAYNLSWSIIHEHMKKAGNARFVMPQSAVDLMDEMTDLPAEIVVVPDGSTVSPKWVGAPQMPQWWVDGPVKLAEEMDDIMGIHQVSRGDAPTNIESGYGLSILAEHDATPIMRMSKEQAMAWSKVATMVLKLYEKMVKGAKRKTVAQVPGQPQTAITWDGSDFKGQTTAVIPYDEIMPRSRAAQMQFADKMMEMKLITDPATYARVADLPNSRSFINAVSPDIAKARRENAMFSLGRMAVPRDFDDHAAHINEHNSWRKSLDYELATPELQDHCGQHIDAHATMAAEAAGKQTGAMAVGGHALAQAPTAAGAPPMAPEMMLPPDQSTPALPAGPASAEAALSPTDTITAQMLESLNTPQPGA